MDPNGENQIVDADSKEAIKVVESSTHENQEDNQQQPPQETHQKGEVKDDEEKEKTESPVQPVEEKPAVPSAQSDQESTATKPEEKDDQHKDKEIGSEKEKEKDSQPPQSKSWKNPRKKKNKEEIRDFAQWPTLDEARHTRGQAAKKPQQTDPNRSHSKSEREKQNQSRTRKGINWKPLSSDLPRSQGADREQSSATATSGEGEGERGTGTTQGSSPTSSSGGPGRGYQGGFSGRGQPRRRGGRGGAPWPRSSHAGSAPQEGATESGAAVVSETEDSQPAQTSQDSASNTQAGQAANPAESRRYRGSTRGVPSRPSSNRWRGNPRPNYFNRYNNNTPGRGQPPYAPLRLPQDQDQFNEQIKKQIEHYFGIDNLCRDIFLRKNMNNEGWISVHLILNFNRVRDLNIDVPRMIEALKDSQVVEVKDEFIRRLDDWARWTFPPRVEGTSQTQSTPQSQENSPAIETNDQ